MTIDNGYSKEDRKHSEFEASLLAMKDETAKLPGVEAMTRAALDVRAYNEAPEAEKGYVAQDMGLRASSNDYYRVMLEKTPEAAAAAREALKVGNPMPKADWAHARDIVGGTAGRVYLPKMFTEYGGTVVMVTDTHLVMQVAKNVAIVHDLKRLDRPARDSGELVKLQGRAMRISYGAISGKSEVLSFDQDRATRVLKEAQQYSERNLKSPAARDGFMNHVEKSMVAAISVSNYKAAPQHMAPAAQRAPDAMTLGR